MRAQGSKLTLTVLSLLAALLACGPKQPATPTPTSGWISQEGWAGACYAPPDFDAIEASGGESARRFKRSDVLDEMMSQWSGGREDGVSMLERVVTDAETVLLGHARDIESVSVRNYELCKEAMASGGASRSWSQWLAALPAELTAGECLNPLTYTLFDYLDLGTAFHLRVPMCKEDVAVIIATASDRFRITDDGPWINAEGDPDWPTQIEEDWPCNVENCYAGMLMAKFVASSGVETAFPVGLRATWRAPEDGELWVGVNDHVFYDNTWFTTGGVIEHTAIEISPAP